jgi:hypothetical protein
MPKQLSRALGEARSLIQLPEFHVGLVDLLSGGLLAAFDHSFKHIRVNG